MNDLKEAKKQVVFCFFLNQFSSLKNNVTSKLFEVLESFIVVTLILKIRSIDIYFMPPKIEIWKVIRFFSNPL